MQRDGKFHIQDQLAIKAPHHESYEQLWETKWKEPCSRGLYPFMFGAIKDFQPVVDKLVEGDYREDPVTQQYNWDAVAEVFFPKAEELVSEAEKAEAEGNNEKASELFLRASAIYRISRFPAPRSSRQIYAWEEGKKAALRGFKLRERPTYEVKVPHTHGLASEGKEIPIYYHLPPGASKSNPVPLVMIFTGLDGYRTELAVWIEGWSRKNVGVIVVEIPGTGDSPAQRDDITSPDRQWSSLIDWIEQQPEIDQKKKAIWAFSTGGYYAIRLAHTHPDKFAGIAAQGGGAHYMFDPVWLSNVNHLEYPFDLASTLAWKFGYGDDLEKFKNEAMKFSLLNDGTLDKPKCARLLLVNGTGDEIFPLDDYELCLRHGAPKEARFVEGVKHMGEPVAFVIILNWLYQILGLEGNPMDQLATVPFQPKY